VRGSTIVTSNLRFDEWISVFGSKRLTGVPLDWLTHHVHILEMNGESYRLAHSQAPGAEVQVQYPYRRTFNDLERLLHSLSNRAANLMGLSNVAG
jgi:hypothetical protein